MSLDRALSNYASRNGLEPLAAKRDGSFVLVFDGRYKLTFIAEGQTSAIVRSTVGNLPDTAPERREMLDHLLGAATARMNDGPETLSIEKNEQDLFLYRRFATDVQPHAFEALLTSFVNGLAFWRRMADSGASRATTTPPPFQMMFR